MARRALIVGAGIGGLAAGRVLREKGFEVRILERAPRLEPLGAGISLWPNAVRALKRIGVGEMASAVSIPDPDPGIRNRNGKLLARTNPAAIQERFGAPILLLHRANLQHELLADGIGDLVQTGVEVAGISEEGTRVIARTSGDEAFEADLVVGADGIHSTVRAELLADGPPRHSGLLAYRGIVEHPGFDIRWGEYWGAGCIFGVVPIDAGRIYWFATRRTEGGEPPEENPIPGLLGRFEGWAPEIRSVIAATPPHAVLRHDLFDRRPDGRWTSGSVALLGDAAHPMLPFLGQGACQALEDAVALGTALGEAEDVPEALRSYQAARRPRASRIVEESRRFGRLSHLRSAPARAVRDRILALTPESVRMRRLAGIVGAMP
ncbi:MAG TPA: FAD-dependent monooxygenase [Solirubrobacterales bacterium]